MKLATLTSVIVMTAATAAFAEGIDADGDGVVTVDEAVAMHPDLTPEAFSTADANDDGVLDAEELAAALEAGLIPNET
ncbi:EF-hand domain-containing protein [Aliiroseovarius sp. F20344]|uniref:EF-hand domain-containing protein n=1 Tax=Aliiroseovarius sp. F20344 TaxID=2926414 RepID=UPI001FF5F730|nr:EF-hand domain-containing protein [Aliiroseovarius sp. F20344]MCK0141603.1 EF-hand domain-containing protein [Aliiroseovarius sp. F20344]